MMWWNEFVGLPYVKGGRDVAGIDCWGLVLAVYAKHCLGLRLPGYGAVTVDEMRDIAAAIATEKQSGIWDDVPSGQERPFDVVVIPTVALGRMGEFHVGVVTRAGHMLHSDENVGCVESCFSAVGLKKPDRNMRFRRCEIFRHKALA